MKKILLPLLVLSVTAVLTAVIVRARPEVDKVPRASQPPVVRVIEVQPTDVQLNVFSQGTVQPKIEADLVAEIAGVIVRTASEFEEGGFFSRGDVLLELDRRDYELAMTNARAQVAQATTALAREEAEAEVAAAEWRELGDGEASPLVLREPQLAEARARVAAAEAVLARAELDLERTIVRAPFAGRLRAKRVDLGEFVNRGTPLATIYSVDAAQIRLPVPDAELAYLELSLADRPGRSGPRVTVRSEFAGKNRSWQGRVVRTGGAIDPSSRMVPLVAEVSDPYRTTDGHPPLSVGLFVEAEIEGKKASGVFTIPRSALRGQDNVLVVDGDRLVTRRISILRSLADTVVVEEGLEPGDRVCLTPLDSMLEGMRVSAQVEPPAALQLETEG